MTDDKRRIDACLRACAGISTQNLEDNAPFIELARLYNVVLRERDELRARIEKMERQSPICSVKDIKRVHYMTKVVGLDPDAWLYLATGAKGEEE